MGIPKNPYPLFASTYACSYANDQNHIVTIHAMKVRKNVANRVIELIHPGDFGYGISDDGVMLLLNQEINRKKKDIYAIQNWQVLQKLLGVDSLSYSDEDTWYNYQTINGHDFLCHEELFKEYGWNLIPNKDEELLDLFLGKKHK